MAKRSTMASDPLDNLDDLKRGGKSAGKGAPAPAAKPEKKQTKPLQAYVPEELLNRARDAVYWTPGVTLTSFVVQALEHEITRLEKERGDPFPTRKQQLRVGRPVGR